MFKDIVKGIASSERVWLTLIGLAVAFLAKKGIALPEGFASQASDMIMVLVASLGLRPPRPKTTSAKLEEAVAKESDKLEAKLVAERAKRLSQPPPTTEPQA